MPNLAEIKQYASLFGKGLLTETAPKIVGGVVNQLCHNRNMNVAMLTNHVENQISIWGSLEPEQQEQLKSVILLLNDLDFITPEIIVNGIKKDFPAVASKLLSWPEGMDWLLKQIDEIKALAEPRVETRKKATKSRKD